MNYEKAWRFLREEIMRTQGTLLGEAARAESDKVRHQLEGGVAALEHVRAAMDAAEEAGTTAVT